MAFVYQELTEEDIKYLLSFRIPYPYGGGGEDDLVEPWGEIPIDRERNIYLFYVGGTTDIKMKDERPTAAYYLVWGKDLIKFGMLMDHSKRDENNKRIYKFYIFRILAPTKYKKRETELLEAIKEAVIENEKGSIVGKFFGRVEEINIEEPLYLDEDIRRTHVWYSK